MYGRARRRYTHEKVPSRAALGLLGALTLPLAAQAEGKISIAQQFGIGYLILHVVKDQQLIEKHGKAQGLDIEVDWRTISGATAMNEALLAGAIDVVSAGVPPMLTVWDRTRGRQNVKAVAALGSLPNYLLSNREEVKTLHDLSDKDRIAVPAPASASSRAPCRSRPPGCSARTTSSASTGSPSACRTRTPPSR